MIELGDQLAAWPVAFTLVGVVAWGVLTSVRAAVLGPGWALPHFRRSIPAWLIVVSAGAGAVLVVRPAWIGWIVAYLAGVAAVLSWNAARSLQRFEVDGGFGHVREEHRQRIIRRTLIGMVRWPLGRWRSVCRVWCRPDWRS